MVQQSSRGWHTARLARGGLGRGFAALVPAEHILLLQAHRYERIITSAYRYDTTAAAGRPGPVIQPSPQVSEQEMLAHVLVRAVGDLAVDTIHRAAQVDEIDDQPDHPNGQE